MRSSDNELIQQTNCFLTEAFKDAQNLLLIIQILQSQQDEFIRFNAAIYLRKCLSIHWKSIVETNEAFMIKSQILQIYSSELNQQIKFYVLYAMSIIIDLEKGWPELLELANSGQLSEIPCMDAYDVLVPSMDKESFYNLLPVFSQHLQGAIQTDDAGLLICGARFFAQCAARFEQPMESPFSDILSHLLEIFKNLSVSGTDAHLLANEIEKIMRNPNCINCEEVLNSFLNTIQQWTESVQTSTDIEEALQIYACNVPHFYTQISTLLTSSPELAQMYSVQIFQLAFNSAALSFINELDVTSDFQTNSNYLISVFDVLCQYVNGMSLYNTSIELLTDSSPGEAYITVSILKLFIEFVPESFYSNTVFFVTTLLKHVSDESHPAVREVCLQSLEELLYRLFDKLSGFETELLNAALSAINSDQVTLTVSGLKLLTAILQCIHVENDHIHQIFGKLGELLQIPFVHTEVMSSLTALIINAQDGCDEYVEQFLPVIVNDIQVSELENPLLKSQAIEALGKLILYSPDKTQSIFIEACQTLVQFTSIADPSIQKSLLDAFGSIASSSFQEKDEVLLTAIEFATQELDLQSNLGVIIDRDFNPEEEDDDQKNQEFNEQLIQELEAAIYFFKTSAENSPSVLQPKAISTLESLQSITMLQHPTVTRAALQAITEFIIAYGLDVSQIMYSISSLFDDAEPIIVSAMFEMCTRLIYQQIQFNEDVYSHIFKEAMKVVKKTSYCIETDGMGEEEDMNEKNAEIDLMETAYELLGNMALFVPGCFNAKEFISAANKNFKNKCTTDVILSTDVLGRIFQTSAQSAGSLGLKAIHRIIFGALDLCDGNMIPAPLEAMRRILDTDFHFVADQIAIIYTVIDQILQKEDQGQPYIKETRSAASSILWSLWRIEGENFDVNKYLPNMISTLPPKYDAGNILSSLISFFQQFSELFSSFIPQILVGVAQILSQKDIELEKLEIPDDVFHNTIIFFSQIHLAEGAQEILSNSFQGSQKALIRALSRIESLQ